VPDASLPVHAPRTTLLVPTAAGNELHAFGVQVPVRREKVPDVQVTLMDPEGK
jgi:hypothetical protein